MIEGFLKNDVSTENRLLFIKIPLASTLEATPYRRKQWGFLDCLCSFPCPTRKESTLLFGSCDAEIKWEAVWRVFWLLSIGYPTRCDLRLLPIAQWRPHTRYCQVRTFSPGPQIQQMLLLGWLEAWWGQTSWKESGNKISQPIRS